VAASNTAKGVEIRELEKLEGEQILSQMIDTGIRPRGDDERARERAESLLRNFVEQILDPGTVIDPNIVRTINQRIAAIDRLLSEQVDKILHHPDLQKLEASWRGLHKLVMGSETSPMLKIKVLNASKKELLRDFDAAAEFTESALWKKVYEYGFGLLGADPFAAIVGDYEFDKGVQDVRLLRKISEVAAASHAPFITAASAAMFRMDSFTQMPDPRDLAKIFDKANAENTEWLSFRDSEDSRFVGLVLPHVLRRLPYGDKTDPIEDFRYEEDVSGAHEDYLWGNAAYEYANRLTESFAKHHWCVAIRGVEGGGLVEGLPIHVFKSREGDVAAKCPTDVMIPDTRELELSDLGFIGLLHRQNSNEAVFIGGNSAQRPKKYDDPAATANADLSSKIPYLMATCRIAHYLKSICRDKIGSFLSRSECETFLNRWISQYVLAQDDASQELKAQRPLREARVEVLDDKARPGCYKANAFLRPHFQLEKLTVALSLVAELPESANK
jgi:type VI secretion system protein ImpC